MEDFLSAAIRRKNQKAAAGRLVLRIHGDSLWRWEVQELWRQQAQRLEFVRRARTAYHQAVLRRRWARNQVVWLEFVERVQRQLWAEEEWFNMWQ